MSSGAACSSGLGQPSPVVRAMYPDDPDRASGAVRFSFGPSTPDEVDLQRLVETVRRVLERARGGPPVSPVLP